jgi:hypothetical protein
LDQQVVAFITYILPCLALAESGVSIFVNFDGSNAKQCALLDQLLNKIKDGLPDDKLHRFACPMPAIQYLPNFDNKRPMISLYLGNGIEAHVPILMKMLASPRPDGRQRVIYTDIWHESMVLMLIRTIQEVKLSPKKI